MTLSLGIDVGTSGVRSAVIDENGALLSEARAPHPAQPGEDIDASLWWRAVEDCLTTQVKALRAQGLDPTEVTAIAVDGTSGSMVLTDGDLKPVGPALMYHSKGFDQEAAEIADHAPDPHITRGSNSALARAKRLVNTATRRPAHLLHQADYVAAKLLGHGGVSDANNALKTGADPETGAWPDWIGNVVDPALLPVVHPVGARLGDIGRDSANRFGFAPTTSIRAGTTDSTAAFIACAPFEPGVAVTSLGSTLAVKSLSLQRIDAPEIGLYSHKVGPYWLVGGASNTGGAVLAHFFAPAELDRLSGLIDPDRPTGLNYYPLIKPGERFPINDPDFAGCMEPRPKQDVVFLAALFEGMAEVERRCYREIDHRGGAFPSTIYTAGGGAKNPVFTAIRKRHLGVEIRTAEHTEAAIGTARIASWGNGAFA